MTITESRQMGRAKNAVLSYLEQHLSIPKIYIDAAWAGTVVDVLAINRAGIGDVHAVLLFPSNFLNSDMSPAIGPLAETLLPLVDRFQDIPAQFKYIAGVDVSPHGADALPHVPDFITERAFSPDGIGRIGFLAIQFMGGKEPEARVVIKPERFRAKIAQLADDYVEKHEADWEIRA